MLNYPYFKQIRKAQTIMSDLHCYYGTDIMLFFLIMHCKL
jgi:hypothetical protein